MEQRISKAIECLSSIEGIAEIEEDNGYIVFCYRHAYFLCFFVEGCGIWDEYLYITLNFDIQLEADQLELARDICFKKMGEYESLLLFINDDAYNSICISFKSDYKEKRLAKAIRQRLNDSIEAHNCFIDHLLMMDTRNLNLQ